MDGEGHVLFTHSGVGEVSGGTGRASGLEGRTSLICDVLKRIPTNANKRRGISSYVERLTRAAPVRRTCVREDILRRANGTSSADVNR